MKLKGKSIRISREKRKTFPAAVSELADNDPEGKLVIYEKAGIKNKYLDEVPILDAVDIASDIERVISEDHGGGEYQLSLFKRDSEVVEKFNYSIAGEPKGRRSGGDKESLKENRNTGDERYYSLLDRLTEAALSNKGSSADEFQKTLQLVKELRGDNGSKEFEKELLTILLNNLVQSNGGDLDKALQIIEISQRLQPELQQEDPLTSLAQTVLPLIGQAIAAKQGASNATVDPNMQEGIRQALAQLEGSTLASPAPTHPMQPGGAGDSTQAPESRVQVPSGLGEAEVTSHEQASEDLASPLAASQEYFQKRFVRPFREDVADDQSDDELAYQIVSMVQYVRDRMADDPPALVADFLTAATLVDHLVALDKFFAGIPELANLVQKCDSVKNALIRRFTQRSNVNPPENVENIEDTDPTTTKHVESAQETEAEQSDNTQVLHEAVSKQI